jgi:hypothetical protein
MCIESTRAATAKTEPISQRQKSQGENCNKECTASDRASPPLHALCAGVLTSAHSRGTPQHAIACHTP